MPQYHEVSQVRVEYLVSWLCATRMGVEGSERGLLVRRGGVTTSFSPSCSMALFTNWGDGRVEGKLNSNEFIETNP